MSRLMKLLPTMSIAAAVLTTGGLVWTSSNAAFSSNTVISGNNLDTGTVTVSNDSGGSAVLTGSGLKPGSTDTRCVNVDYTGTLAGNVRLWAEVYGGLPQYLTVQVEAGTGAAGGAGTSCAGFTGATTIYNGSMNAFPTSYANAAATNWAVPAGPQTRSYRFTYTVQDNASAAGQAATFFLHWESNNS